MGDIFNCSRKAGVVLSCKLSPEESPQETSCMKCQTPFFLGKIKNKYILKSSLLKVLPSMLYVTLQCIRLAIPGVTNQWQAFCFDKENELAYTSFRI